METSRDIVTETNGSTSFRLRYSRQFQSGGHTHTIDVETTLPLGASSEKREQVIHELETGVEQLARQIVQRGSRQASEIHPQPSTRPGAAGRTTELPAPPPPLPRPAAYAAQPTVPMPVSESMPAAPTASGGTITLPKFLSAIKKRWDMSPEEAMRLLHVQELTGLNYREVYSTLQTIKEPNSAPNSNPGQARARTTQQYPVVETPPQANRGPAPSNAAPVIRTSGKYEAPQATQTAPVFANVPETKPGLPEQEHRQRPDFAGSSKAPLPIQLGVVRDMVAAPRSYTFEEEEEEEEYDLPENEDAARRHAAESKLEELKTMRGGNASSPERLNVLSNVLDGQISEEQLEQLTKAVWGVTSKKRLKVPQVEALISWAKEDYFADEVESLLALVAEEGE